MVIAKCGAHQFHKMKKPLSRICVRHGVSNQIPPSWSEKSDIVSAVDGVVDLEIDLEDSEERLDVEEVCAGGRQHLALRIFLLSRLLALQKRLNE